MVTRLSNEEAAEKLSQIAEFLNQFKGDRKSDQPLPLTLLLDLLEDPNPRVRWRAVEALGVLKKPEKILDSLITALQDPNSVVRWNAAIAIGEFGDSRATLPLLDVLQDDSKDVREIANWALVELGEKIVFPLIDVLTTHQDWWFRRDAARILGLIGDERATAPLIQALDDQRERVRESAAEALGRLGGALAIKALILALQDEYGHTRENAVKALTMKGPKAVEQLIPALEHPNKMIRISLCEVLGILGDPRAIKPLQKLRHDSDFKLRRYAAKALKQIQQKID